MHKMFIKDSIQIFMPLYWKKKIRIEPQVTCQTEHRFDTLCLYRNPSGLTVMALIQPDVSLIMVPLNGSYLLAKPSGMRLPLLVIYLCIIGTSYGNHIIHALLSHARQRTN